MGSSSSVGSLAAPTNLLQLQEARVAQNGAAPKRPTDDAKIDKSSQQFEAILVGTWLKEAQQSFGSVPGGDTDRDAGGEQMMSLGVQSLSTSMAASGGLGIGKMIVKYLEQHGGSSESGEVKSGLGNANVLNKSADSNE